MIQPARRHEIAEAAAKIVEVLRGPVRVRRDEDRSLPYEAGSVAYSLQHALSWTATLSDKRGQGRRRWCTVSAQLLVSCLERDFEITHQGHTREELLAIVAAALLVAPARPDRDWIGRQPWAHQVAGTLAESLASDLTVIRALRKGSARRKDQVPTWK